MERRRNLDLDADPASRRSRLCVFQSVLNLRSLRLEVESMFGRRCSLIRSWLGNYLSVSHDTVPSSHIDFAASRLQPPTGRILKDYWSPSSAAICRVLDPLIHISADGVDVCRRAESAAFCAN